MDDLASLAYASFLIPALQEYELTAAGATILAIRVLFFFLAAILVNQFAMENKRQVERYQELSETLEETNRQLRRAEEEARRSERLAALGQLSAGLAHEIRNPAGRDQGRRRNAFSESGGHAAAGERAGGIHFLRGEPAERARVAIPRFRAAHEPGTAAAADFASGGPVARIGAPPIAGLKVKVERHYAAALPEILADEQLCERVFVNLIMNAYQAMAALAGRRTDPARLGGAGNLERRAWRGGHIEDTGPGVPAEIREQIFNPFFTSKKDGVGLGLSIVAKIVDDHRGWIKLESEPGRGARFHVFLPARTVA